MFDDIYRRKRVLITGHTGFKGSWLALWLKELGADVVGIALPPEALPNHWDLLALNVDEYHLDTRASAAVTQAILATKPEVVFHLAAQPLVRRSYREPLETWSTNVMGTVNLLEACRETPSASAIIAVATDKCCENREWSWGYRESDQLGGHDPYSASKASTELVVSSFRSAFFDAETAPLLATARAGNVIGGGDWSEDRLIPDLARAVTQGDSLEVRSPLARRPWQHVLESLSAYLLLGQRLLQGDKTCAAPRNFGPANEDNQTVLEVFNRLSVHWPSLRWHVTDQPQPLEPRFFTLIAPGLGLRLIGSRFGA